MKKKNFINYCGLLGVAAFISYGFVEIKPLKVGGNKYRSQLLHGMQNGGIPILIAE